MAVAGALAASATACEPSPQLPETARRPLPACEWADVVSVVDGDTIRVEIGGAEESVRYIGIDAPEARGEGAPEPFAKEATGANEALVGGKRVCLESDVSDRDRFDRLLRYAWLEDGRMVNEALVLAGLAEARAYRPDTKHQATILDPAEEAARAAGRGIWE